MNELFQQLYSAYSRQVYAYLLGRTSNKDIASDLLQDIFLRVWNRMESIQRIPDEQQLYWIFSIASNRIKDYYRRSSVQKKAEQKLHTQDNGIEVGDLSQLLAGKEQFRELESAIRRLPDELRCILLMKVVGDMNSAQISEALNIPAGTVRYKVSQARKMLAQQLGLSHAGVISEGRKPNE